MAGRSRDVKLTLSVETLGQDQIEALQRSLQDLANEGGSAAPAFQELADQVGRLGEQSAALNTFARLSEETGELRTKQEAAAQAAQELGVRLQELQQSTEQARARQEAAAAAYQSGQRAATEIATAIRVLNTQYDSAGRQTAEYRARLGELVQAQGAVKVQVQELRTAQRDANAELAAAEQAQTKASTAYGAASKQASAAASALQAQERATKDAAKAAQALGVATDDIAGSQGRLTAALKGASAAADQLNSRMTLADRLAAGLRSSLGQISAGNLIADGVGYLVNKVKDLASAFVASISQGEQFRRALNAIYKDADTTARQLDFLRATALSSGVSVGDISQAFVKFSAATRSANIPLAQTNELFAAVTGAAGTLGLSGESVTGMLEALGQMASKGTVSLEELRQQLGDRLPGALSLVAQGFGISEAALVKLVESGGLAARDLFPALTGALKGMQGETAGLTSTFENLKSVLVGVAQDAGDAGWAVLLNGALKVLGATLGFIGLSLSIVTEGLFTAGKGALLFFETLRGNGSEALAFFNEEIAKSNERLEKQALRFKAMLDPAGESAARLREMATAQASVADSAARAAVSSQTLSTTTAGTTAGLLAQKLAADAMAGGAANLSANYVRLNSELETMLVSLAKQTEAADKQAKAVKIEGDASAALTALRGNERESLEALARASENNLQALRQAAAAHAAETEVLTTKRDALVRLAQQQDGDTTKRAQEIDAINRKILVSKAETEQAMAAVEAARVEALARDIARKAYEGNAQAVGTLERAMVAAQATEASYARQHAEGRISLDDYRQAQDRTTEATALYNRALQESSRLITADGAARQAKTAVDLASLGVQQQAYERLAAASRATGDLAQATYYEIEAKRVQIQVTQLTAEAKRKEAEASSLAANAELEALKKTGALTEVKRLEIEARLANAKAKAIEAGAAADIVRALEAEIGAIRNNVGARSGGLPSINADTSARLRNRDAIDAQTAALVKQRTTADGFATNPDGSAAGSFNNALTLDKAFAIKEKASRGTLTADDLTMAQAAFEQARAALSYVQGLNSSASSEARRSVEGLYVATQAALQRVQDLSRGNAPKSPSAAPAPVPGGSSAHTVTVNLGGKSTTISTATADDATALVDMLKDLETAAARAL